MAKNSRDKAIDAAIQSIQRAFGKGAIMRYGDSDLPTVDTMSTGSMGIDIGLGIGGFPHGRVVEIFGNEASGKTTIARIFAKSLNCEKGVSSIPCGECSSCLEIDQGRFIDLLEVDAASRTKVEDTRDLLDNVQYAPSRGRYKVYLIDEVHMLSGHSFNALLKTLEEPPPHVKFLLATTDPQKLPATVLSRCLQFNLKRLPVNLIQDRLTLITEKEKMDAEAAALNQIARAARSEEHTSELQSP